MKRSRFSQASIRIRQCSAGLLSAAVAAALCSPGAGWAQSASSSPAAPAALLSPAPSSAERPASDPQDRQATPQTAKAAGDASSGGTPLPLTTYVDAAGNPQSPAGSAPPKGSQQAATQQTEPQGAATAEKVSTAGGAAAKPAGAAIAPAKQRQARSLLIKLGAVAASAVAAGTIYALSRGTPSLPPGTNNPSAMQKRPR